MESEKHTENYELTSGCGSSGIMVHGRMEAEFSAVVEEVAIGVVKPWQKAAAVAATQRDSDSLMVAIISMSNCVVVLCVCREREESA